MIFLLVASYPRSLLMFRGPLLQALKKSGFDVHVACPDLDDDESVRLQLEELGVSTHQVYMKRTGISPVGDFKTLLSLARVMCEIKPDYVLSYTIKPVIYGSLAAWLAKVPRRYALVTGLGYAFTGEAKGKRRLIQMLATLLYRQALKSVHLVFFQNVDDNDLFRKLRLVPPATPTIVVNGSGVDIDLFDVAPLPQGMPRFLLIARLLGDKGVREYVHAAAAVRANHPDVQFHLVGDLDPNPDSITRAELDDWISSGTIEYHGWLNSVTSVIADATIYVLPSYREGTPRTVLEAMAMGRPIITTDAPGCRETVIDGENGFLVPVKDVAALTSAMMRFVKQPELVVSMGRKSREIAVEKYDVNKINKRMLSGMGLTRDE